jgi:hypothetical protein
VPVFTEAERAALGLINLYNRANVITRQPAGDYQPGQWK